MVYPWSTLTGCSQPPCSPSCVWKHASRGLTPWFSQGMTWSWLGYGLLDFFCPFLKMGTRFAFLRLPEVSLDLHNLSNTIKTSLARTTAISLSILGCSPVGPMCRTFSEANPDSTFMHFWLVSSPFKPSSKHESLEDFGENWEGNDYLSLTCLCCHLPRSAVVPIFLIQPFTTNVDSLCWPWCPWKVSALGELCVSWHHPTNLGSVSIPLLHSPPLLTPPVTALEANGEFPFHQLSTVSLHCTWGGPNSCLLMEREGETYNLHKLASKLNCSLIKYHCST